MKHAALAAILASGLVGGLSAQGYLPHRVFDTAARQFTDFEAMASDLASADVVFVGEQHDDPNTHRLERLLLEALAARRGGVILSLEMFERDVQARLDEFQAGYLSEAGFLRVSRPWPRYATDYKPLVDFAVDRGWPVVAANIPRPIASDIARSGIEVLAGRPEADRPWFAGDWQCPVDDEYFARFKQAMGSHPSMDQLQRYYDSQCLKDETMAESIARAWTTAAAADASRRPLVVHYNGAFHSDFGLGTASRTQRRLPGTKVAVITMVPVKDLAALGVVTPSDEDLRRARYLVYTTGK